MGKRDRTIIILILGFLSAIGPFSIDMYLSAFPAIAENLHTSIEMVSYSLSSYFIGISIGQLFAGPLLDRYGRKKPIYVGLSIYMAATFACTFADSVEWLILFRFFQALGASLGLVAPRAIISDLFPIDQRAKLYSYMILILGIAPIVAPSVGSYVVTHYSWQSIFLILTGIVIILLLTVIFRLPESKKPDPNFSINLKSILENYWLVFKQPQFLIYTLSGAISFAGFFAYLSGSPYVLMELFGATEQEYGMIFSIIAVGLIASSQVNNLLTKKFTSKQLVKGASTCQALIGISLFILSIMGILNLLLVIVMIFLYISCLGFIFPNSVTLCLAPFSKLSGSASALMGSIQMTLGALTASIVGLFAPKSAIPMSGTMAFCAIIGLLVLCSSLTNKTSASSITEEFM